MQVRKILKFLNFECRPVPENKWAEVGKAVLYQIPAILLGGLIMFAGVLVGGFGDIALASQITGKPYAETQKGRDEASSDITGYVRGGCE